VRGQFCGASTQSKEDHPVESIHDLFDKVRKHPDYVAGTVFVRDDFAPEKVEKIKESTGRVEEAITEAGFEAAEFVMT
jgi:hypothetical protein